jgi:uncharacterized protein (TIGR03435 family)
MHGLLSLLVGLLLLGSTAVAQNDTAAAAQVPPPSMTFSVASIRPVKIGPGVSWGGIFFEPSNSSHLTTTSDLRAILQTAFSVQYYQIVGYDQPLAVYTIQAHADEDADKRLATLPKAQRQAEQEHMFQALLVDRFRLKFHLEDRPVPGYRLVIAKRGSKLLPAGSLPLDARDARMTNGDGETFAIHQHRDDLGGIMLQGRRAVLTDIAQDVAFRMGAPVQDATGLEGRYDFDLRIPDRTPGATPQDRQAQIIDAVQDQLGLHLEAARITQKVLVIDHVEPPSPN